jgi:hypothetical protein
VGFRVSGFGVEGGGWRIGEPSECFATVGSSLRNRLWRVEDWRWSVQRGCVWRDEKGMRYLQESERGQPCLFVDGMGRACSCIPCCPSFPSTVSSCPKATDAIPPRNSRAHTLLHFSPFLLDAPKLEMTRGDGFSPSFEATSLRG